MYIVIIMFLGVLYSNVLEYDYENLSNTRQEGLSSIHQEDITNKYSQENIYLEETIDPKNYFVGPGDIFLFNMISSDGMHTLNLTVSPLGTVLIPNVGDIFVDKMLLSDAFDKIKDTCFKHYSNAKVYLTLKSIRKFKIQTIGTIPMAGFIVVNPLSRVSDVYNKVIASSEKPLRNTISRRNITLHRNDEIISVDLVKYNMNGDNAINPYVMVGDVIEFSIQKYKVVLKGGIKIPDKYEYTDNENIYELIKIAGGFTANADSNYVEISRFIDETNQKKIIVSEYDKLKSFIISPNDFIQVRVKKDYKRRDVVEITGEIKFPGYYIFDNHTKISDIINLAGGLSSKADSNQIIITNDMIHEIPDYELKRISLIEPQDRTPSEKSYIKSRKKINKGLIISGSLDRTKLIYDYKLEMGDKITIPLKLDYVEIIGAVSHPGRFEFSPSMHIKEYIKDAGGKSKNASGRMYIIDSSSNQKVRARNNMFLNNGDVLFVEQKEDYSSFDRFKDIMIIFGQAAALYAVINTAGN